MTEKIRKYAGKLQARLEHDLRQGIPATVREARRRSRLKDDQGALARDYVRRIRLTEAEKSRQRAEHFGEPMRISIAVPLYNTPEDVLREMLQSVREQTYGEWELCLADGSDAAHGQVGEICRAAAQADPRIRYRKLEKNGGISENTNAAIAMASGAYIALLDHDDLLTPDALFEARKAIAESGADFIYSDELIFESPDPEKIVGIRFKPDYAPDFLRTNNYICHLTLFSRALWDRAGGFRAAYDGCQDFELFLRMTDAAEKIRHIPRVLYLWRAMPGSIASDIHEKDYAIDAGRRAVRDFIAARTGARAEVASTEVFPTMFHVRYPIEGTPTVRILAETEGRDAGRALEAFRRETESASVRVTEVRAGKAGGQARVLRAAAAEVEEDYLLFLRGIPKEADGPWIREMLSLAQLAHVGAVGARILTPGGLIRHAGIVLGMGEEGLAGRPYYRMDGRSAGYFGQMAVAQNVSAVSAECMMVQREKYLRAGGFDPAYGDALFDADFCLRLREAGYENVITPHAALRSGSRTDFRFDLGREERSWPRDAARFREKWGDWLKKGDPFYNPNLSLKYEDWRLRGADEPREK